MSITINGATNTISSTGTVTLPTVAGVTSLGNTALGDAEASDTHAIKGATTLLASSASAALTVTQTGAGNAFVVEDSASTDSTPFVIDASGKVVVGGATSVTTGLVEIQDTGSAPFALVQTSDTSTNASWVDAYRKRTTGPVVQSGDRLGGMRFFGNDGTNYIEAASITAEVDGTPGTNDMPGRLVFSTTADGASSPTERMRIDSKGAIGIGFAPSAGYSLQVGKPITGGTSAWAIASSGTIQPDVTNQANMFLSLAATKASAFTLSMLNHYLAYQSVIGAGSTVTYQYGFAADGSLVGASYNYGFYGAIPSGANRYNFYAAGTAPNYFGGNVTVGGGGTLGYGAGSGGTVTQATSKSTSVTLNKPSGQITMHNAALAAGAAVTFEINNSTFASTDVVVFAFNSGATAGSYSVVQAYGTTGVVGVTLRNVSAGSLSEAVVLNFAVIKGSTS